MPTVGRVSATDACPTADAGTRPQRTLHMLRGLPGAGKTTRARQLATEHPDWIIVSVDDIAARIRRTCRHTGRTITAADLARHTLRTAVNDIAAAWRHGAITVIIDAPNLDDTTADAWQHLADHHHATLVIDVVGTDLATCQERNRERADRGERSVRPDTIAALARSHP